MCVKSAKEMFNKEGYYQRDLKETICYINKKYKKFRIYIHKKYASFYLSLPNVSVHIDTMAAIIKQIQENRGELGA
jgi:hypothetical protein